MPSGDAGLTPEEQDTLVSFLLSPAASTERQEVSNGREAIGVLPESTVRELLEAHVPNIAFMLDRTGCTPVADYIWMSYQNGLPIYRGDPSVQQHTINAMRYIFNAAATGEPKGGPDALKRLAEAYQSCQAEQGRTIDALYRKISGRDASIRDQVLALVDSFKALTLEAVVHELNPRAAGMGDHNPSMQAPHITSAYLEAVGAELGLRGVAAARRDENRPRRVQRERVLQAFRGQFNVADLAGALAADVNQQAENAERVIDRDLLAEWASAEEGAGAGFSAHSIFFDEENAGDYDGRPEKSGEYQPYLSRKVALQVLARMFLEQRPKGAEDAVEVSKEEQEQQALLSFLLSPAASTEHREAEKRRSDGEAAAVPELSEAEVRELLEKHVPLIGMMLDRTGCTPVATYLWFSYSRGLPIYDGTPEVQQHTVRAVRFIFNAAVTGAPGGAAALQRLAEAFQSCQAEQGRTIDALYGKLSGRDASLEDQVLILVDSLKALTMESVLHEMNPQAAGMGDHSPSDQAPHITSAYLEAVGARLGMRGVAAASNDVNRPPVPDPGRILALFREKFSLTDLAGALAADVNQQAADAERVIDRDLLAKWASASAGSGGFDAHSIYFDEERAGDFDGRPEGSGEFQPFLSRRVAMDVLVRLFVQPSPAAAADAAADAAAADAAPDAAAADAAPDASTADAAAPPPRAGKGGGRRRRGKGKAEAGEDAGKGEGKGKGKGKGRKSGDAAQSGGRGRGRGRGDAGKGQGRSSSNAAQEGGRGRGRGRNGTKRVWVVKVRPEEN